MHDPGSVSFVNVGEELKPTAAAQSQSSSTRGEEITDTPDPQPIPKDGSIGSKLLHQALAGPPHESNWELVNATHSTTGHSLVVMRPQVAYYPPQPHMAEDLPA